MGGVADVGALFVVFDFGHRRETLPRVGNWDRWGRGAGLLCSGKLPVSEDDRLAQEFSNRGKVSGLLG